MTDNKLNLEKMSDFFSSRVDIYDEHMMKNIGGEFFYKEVGKLIPKAKNLSLVDLGCGTGLEIAEIIKVNPTVKITGIDLSADMLRVLKEKFNGKTGQIDIINDSYFNYDFGRERFDGAISVQSLHHFSHEDKSVLYTRLYKGIKEGGFYIEADYYAPDQRYEDFYFAENERIRKEQKVKIGEFYHYDTPCTISNQTQLFFKAGFSSVKLCYMNGNTGVFFLKK